LKNKLNCYPTTNGGNFREIDSPSVCFFSYLLTSICDDLFLLIKIKIQRLNVQEYNWELDVLAELSREKLWGSKTPMVKLPKLWLSKW
jgi:hypothetical protein